MCTVLLLHSFTCFSFTGVSCSCLAISLLSATIILAVEFHHSGLIYDSICFILLTAFQKCLRMCSDGDRCVTLLVRLILTLFIHTRIGWPSANFGPTGAPGTFAKAICLALENCLTFLQAILMI